MTNCIVKSQRMPVRKYVIQQVIPQCERNMVQYRVVIRYERFCHFLKNTSARQGFKLRANIQKHNIVSKAFVYYDWNCITFSYLR